MNWKFWEYLHTGPWLNTEKYELWVIIIFFLGCMFWLVAYAAMYKRARKYNSLEYPYVGQASAYAWEIWFGLGIVSVTDMGLVLQIAYFLWFVFDTFLVRLIWKVGHNQMVTPSAKKTFRLQYLMAVAFWVVVWYPFMKYLDDPVGAFSGWVCNNALSIAFVTQKLKVPNWGTSRVVAIFKFLGTFFCSVVVWTHYSSNVTLAVLAVTFALFDLYFIYLVFTGPREEAMGVEYQESVAVG